MGPSPGSRLGPYEITAAIGAGGMGEALAIAKQIAEALEEAHEHGIVHP
jgi:serine/threonine protein kinase